MKKIMDCFPAQLKPRDIQTNTLLELAKTWNKADIFVVNLPVASGKSAISMTIARWAKQAAVITPSKLLVDQYLTDYPRLPYMKGKKDYFCATIKRTLDKRPKSLGNYCSNEDCEGCRSHYMHSRRARVVPYLLANFYTYMAYKLYREVLIVDEAHQLIPMIKSIAGKKIWCHRHRMPSDLKTREDIKKWVNALPDEAFTYHYNLDHSRVDGQRQDLLVKLKEELNANRPTYLVRMTEDTYEEHEGLPVVVMEPLDIRNVPETKFMWPSKVKKMVLLSATLSRKDIEQLGLVDKRIRYIEADSPIAAERRPVVIPACAANMAFANQDENLPKLVKFIAEAAECNAKTKGLVHITYSLSERLRKQIEKDVPELMDRLLFHNRDNKTEVYNKFRQTEEPKILVASGMYEGIDLPYNAGGWQILAKVPWPSLADPAIKYMADIDQEYYVWETIKTVLQACGRICRTPTDYGETLIFDATFKRLYNQNKEFFPLWFQNSVRIY